MAWFEDLSPCRVFPGEWNNLLAVGWLAKGHEFARGPVDSRLVNQFARLGRWSPPGTPRFVRRCDLCRDDEISREEPGWLFLPGDGVLYVTPRLFKHYVQKHGYQPPPEFLDALRNAPWHDADYIEAVRRHLLVPAGPLRDSAVHPAEELEGHDGLESVRLRPGLYFGPTNVVKQMLFEIVGNGMNEYLAGAATRIAVGADDQGWISVEDDGRGIPVETSSAADAFEKMVSRLHLGAKLNGHHPHVHVRSRHHGVGFGAVSALSARLEVETRRDGVAYRAAFQSGRVVERVHDVGPTQKRGTVIRFLPDDEVLDDGARLDLALTEERLQTMSWLCPGLDIRLQGRSLQRPGGLPGWVRELAPNLVTETALSALGTVNDVDVEISFGWRPSGDKPLIRACANYALTEESGSQQKGFLVAIKQVIPEMNASKRMTILSGLVAVIHVRMLHPRFGGPTRARLEDQAAQDAVHAVVMRAINEAPWWWDRLHEVIG